MLRKEWNIILCKEECKNRQNAKQRWLLSGDKKSKFFHVMVRAYREKITIERLQKEYDRVVTDRAALEEESTNYFGKIFEGGPSNGDGILNLDWSKIRGVQNNLLNSNS